MTDDAPGLNRSLGLSRLVLYGAGTILGAGIYVLVGEVVASSGLLSPLAFIGAALIVAFSAYSFARLASRFPVSAGESAYVQAAFGRPWLATAVGFAIIFVGVTSSATIARGFHGYLAIYVDTPSWLACLVFVSLLTWVATRGVGLSVGAAALATVLEITGLALVIISAGGNFSLVIDNPQQYFIPQGLEEWRGVALGAFLAFYACIGFEDMVNIAEEVKQPERNLPLGIALVLIITTVLYILVTLAALTTLPMNALAGSQAPLALVVEAGGLIPVAVIALISAVAVTNGALIQIIMGSRVLYGLARRGLAPRSLGIVHPSTRTPWRATLIVGAAVAIFSVLLPLATLAQITSAIVLCVFTLVNLALLTLNLRDRNCTPLSLGMPGTGAILCVVFLFLQMIA